MGWEWATELLEFNPRSLEPDGTTGLGLLDRLPLANWPQQAREAAASGTEPAYLSGLDRVIGQLPLASWHEQALDAAASGTEPPYLKTLSRLLTSKLAAMPSLRRFSTATLSPDLRKQRALQVLLSMNEYINVPRNAANDGANAVAGVAAWNAVGRAARDAAWSAAGAAARDAAGDAAWAAAGDAAWSAAWAAASAAAGAAASDAARTSAEDAIARLRARAGVDHPPTAEQIGKAAYRGAELAAQIVLLKKSATVVEEVFAKTADHLPAPQGLPMFDTPADWEAFKSRYFGHISSDEDKMHYLRPWLGIIDQLVREDEERADATAPEDGRSSAVEASASLPPAKRPRLNP